MKGKTIIALIAFVVGLASHEALGIDVHQEIRAQNSNRAVLKSAEIQAAATARASRVYAGAIILAGALVGCGLFLGLKKKAPAE